MPSRSPPLRLPPCRPPRCSTAAQTAARLSTRRAPSTAVSSRPPSPPLPSMPTPPPSPPHSPCPSPLPSLPPSDLGSRPPSPPPTRPSPFLCLPSPAELHRLREENAALRARLRAYAGRSRHVSLAPPPLLDAPTPLLLQPSPATTTFGVTTSSAIFVLLVSLVAAAHTLHPPLLVATSALLGACLLFGQLPPAPYVDGTAPPSAAAVSPTSPSRFAPSSPRARPTRGRMRHVSMEIAEGVAYRAASILVDDTTKRGLPELLVAHVTESALTNDPSHLAVDVTERSEGKRVSMSRMKRVSIMVPSSGNQTLPAAAESFVGEWAMLEQTNYDEFLKEAIGMSWAVRRIAQYIIPTPAFHIQDGALHCVTTCLGAQPVHEILEVGESTWYEPNLGVEYSVTGRWEGDAFVNVRRSSKVNHGRATTQTRRINEAGELVIVQEWGGNVGFTSRFVRKIPLSDGEELEA
mmetsp:Transcript_13731/g.32790  ORF Transcript_13731/g.32790 Transcript_13731/m.32790 type:complete len:464 (-) Transcript_13731:117-1508(-)